MGRSPDDDGQPASAVPTPRTAGRGTWRPHAPSSKPHAAPGAGSPRGGDCEDTCAAFGAARGRFLTRRSLRTRALGGLALTAATLIAGEAGARPPFEPTDVSLEESGTVEIDTQIGLLRTSDARWKSPLVDVELDVGVAPGVEIDLDFAYAALGPESGRMGYAESAPDNLWAAMKLGLLNRRDEATGKAWSIVAQLGPRVPTSRGAHGAGGEALLLVGRTWPGQHVVLNVGAAVDPAPEAGARRPAGIELGIDVDYDLDRAHRFSLLGEIGGFAALTGASHQVHATLGVGWSATSWRTLSASGLAGFVGDSDRFGVLLGVSPKWAIWQ